jgi:hypothetical protein
MKQIVILYALCDLMHTEIAPNVQNYVGNLIVFLIIYQKARFKYNFQKVLKLINAYCSTSFTLMSTNLDKALSVPWSSSTASIISLGTDADDPNQFSSLFDLVNGLYLIDSRFMEVI